MLAPPGVEAGPLAIRPVAQPGLRPRGGRGLRLGGRCVLVGGRTAVPGSRPLAARPADGRADPLPPPTPHAYLACRRAPSYRPRAVSSGSATVSPASRRVVHYRN